MKTQIILRLLSFSILFSSCNESNNYEYYDDFSKYLTEIHDISVENISETFFLLPVNGCDSCIELNVELLLNGGNYNIQLILIGETYDNERSEKINQLLLKYPGSLFDRESEISQYRTGFSKPMLVAISKGICSYQLDISDFKVNEAHEFLENKIIH